MGVGCTVCSGVGSGLGSSVCSGLGLGLWLASGVSVGAALEAMSPMTSSLGLAPSSAELPQAASAASMSTERVRARIRLDVFIFFLS